MANQADGPSQPISQESSSRTHQEELVMAPDISGHAYKLKRPRHSDSEEPISTSRSHTDSTDHDTTDSWPPAMQNIVWPFPTDGGGGSYIAVKESCSSSVEIIEETVRTSIKRRRVQHDGHEDGNLIQYASSNRYLWLNDCGTYDLEMTNYLPIETDPLREKYLFKWTPKAPRAGLLTVLNNNYYVALDTSSSPPKKMKIVMEPPTNNGLVYRYEESPEFCMLFFNYNDKCYQIKVDENGAPTVEERKSQDDLNEEYMWRASL